MLSCDYYANDVQYFMRTKKKIKETLLDYLVKYVILW